MKGGNKNRPHACTFCGRAQDEVQMLVAGPDDVYICDSCVEGAKDIINAELHGTFAVGLPTAMKPADIKAHLDQYVVGQDDAKRVLAVAVYNHYKHHQ